MNNLVALLSVSLAIPVAVSGQEPAASGKTPVRGIAYSATMNRLAIAVESANGRGRIDVTQKVSRPIVLLDSINVAPLGEPGDYYLFDSTTVLLVQPKLHTFTAFVLRNGAYDFDDGRGGWPTEFELPVRIRVDTVSPNVPLERESRPDGPIQVFWHLDVDWDLPTFEVISRGRLSTVAAPPGEATVIRWIEPTLALLSLASRDSTWFPNERFGLTSVTPLAARPEGPVTNFASRNRIHGVRITEIERSRLVLPGEFAEARRASANATPMQEETLAKWRAWP